MCNRENRQVIWYSYFEDDILEKGTADNVSKHGCEHIVDFSSSGQIDKLQTAICEICLIASRHNILYNESRCKTKHSKESNYVRRSVR